MSEQEVVDLFYELQKEARCPKCGAELIGGYYNPEELVKGPSDGVRAVLIPIDMALAMGDPGVYGQALYVQCSAFGPLCDFRQLFYSFYKQFKKVDRIRRKKKQE